MRAPPARWVLPAIVVVAFAARLLPVLRGGGLSGILAYDDGVYFSAAESFVFGRLPYRDFLLLHPPGIVLALSPFALLARLTTDVTGFAAARLAFMALGALNAALVYRVARRAGPVAGPAAGLFYAVWGPAVSAEQTTLLEPLVNLGLLSGLLLLGDQSSTSRRRMLAAGAVLGLATAVKLWAVVPLAVLLVWLLVRRRPRDAATFALGSAAAAAAVCLPFFVMAPERMFRLLVLDQLGRATNGVAVVSRLAGITDASHMARLLGGSAGLMTALLSSAAVVAVALATWLHPRARLWCALLVVQATLLLAGPLYFTHYAAYVAPALALVVGAVVGRGWLALRARAPALRPLAVGAAALAAYALLAATLQHPAGRPRPDEAVRAAVVDARCVAGDTPSTLVTADLLGHDLRNDCTVLVDPTGLAYNQDDGDLAPGSTLEARRADPEWQHRLRRYFAASDAVILQDGNPDGLSAATLRSLDVDLHVDLDGRIAGGQPYVVRVTAPGQVISGPRARPSGATR